MDACESSRFSIRQGEDTAGHFTFELAPSNDLICAICMEPWQHAVELQPCGHIFCKACILQLPPSHATCPTCRSVPTGKAQPNRILRNMVEALRVTCDVCEWNGSMEEYRRHPCTDKDFANCYAKKKEAAAAVETRRAAPSAETALLQSEGGGGGSIWMNALSHTLFGDDASNAGGRSTGHGVVPMSTDTRSESENGWSEGKSCIAAMTTFVVMLAFGLVVAYSTK